jgi:hypothetical protein
MVECKESGNLACKEVHLLSNHFSSFFISGYCHCVSTNTLLKLFLDLEFSREIGSINDISQDEIQTIWGDSN